MPDIQIFMVGEQVTARVWRAAPRVWPPDRHRDDDAITMPLRGLFREMVVLLDPDHILRGYEFAPPFLNNRSETDDYVVIQACCPPVSCCLFHSVVHSSSVDFSLRHTLPVPGMLGGLRTLKAAAVDTLFVIFFGL